MRKIEKMITDDALQSAVEYGSHTFHFTTYCDKDDSLNGKHISWHWHREFQFSQVISGTVNYRIDMEKFSLSEGDCLFINNNIIHSYVVKNGIMKNAIFLDEFLAPVTSTVYRKYIAPVGASDLKYFVVRKEDVAMRELTERLKTLFGQDERTSDTWELEVYCAALNLWNAFFKGIRNQIMESKEKYKPNRIRHERMQIMLGYIHENFSQPITLDEIAAAATISKSEALRCFHTTIQSTPQRYLIDYRLERAQILLKNSSESIDIIAWKTGFRSAGYFCSAFKKVMGVTPSAFRKQAQQTKDDVRQQKG